MPVIVVGADTHDGRAIIDRFGTDREVRAFVTDESQADALRRRGVKVALGDVSDDGHVEAACTGCFTAVLVAAAATDGRDRSFASTAEAVLEGWARAVVASRVTRVIWVADDAPETGAPEVATVPPGGDVANRVATLDDAQRM
jgi:nucleoside-diphosphate-sugar epimerase